MSAETRIDPHAVRAVVVLRERPDAAALKALRKLLGHGFGELTARIEAGAPLLDRELFGNDHLDVAELLDDVLAIVEPLDHRVHECRGDESPSEQNRIRAAVLREILAPAAAAAAAAAALRTPEPDAALTDALSTATRQALADLRAAGEGPWCAIALVTTGEALRPYLALTLHGPDRWDLAGSTFAVAGDEHFTEAATVWDARGDLFDRLEEAVDAEYGLRFASMEAALRQLESEGEFGSGEERSQVLLLIATMPPDETDAGFARRLNPEGPLLDDWLAEAAEGA